MTGGLEVGLTRAKVAKALTPRATHVRGVLGIVSEETGRVHPAEAIRTLLRVRVVAQLGPWGPEPSPPRAGAVLSASTLPPCLPFWFFFSCLNFLVKVLKLQTCCGRAE